MRLAAPVRAVPLLAPVRCPRLLRPRREYARRDLRSCRPASVSANRRDVRLMSRAPSLASILLTAFETVALESFSSAAALAKERSSTTLANIASPSKSGSLVIGLHSETMSFDSFYFLSRVESISVFAKHQALAGRNR